ncbi:hypothetical protein PMSD_15960 [Paenibacillus macquariensis subsp. defensor]|nr:hypothetical protein PMSD_15960 [Paenibacillus macquariensis subsp. defensor]
MDHPYTHKANGELKYLGQWHYVVSSRQLNWLAHEALTFGGDSGWSVLIASHVPITQDEVIGADHAIRIGMEILLHYILSQICKTDIQMCFKNDMNFF